MKKEDKELLLKDICSRLPYGVKCDIGDNKPYTLSSISDDYDGILIRFKEQKNSLNVEIYLSECKPYLFPLSSMTDEQKEELFFNYIHNDIYFDDFTDYFLTGGLWHDICVSMDALPALIDWLDKNHIDYRGLIEKGLAIDATGLNIYN